MHEYVEQFKSEIRAAGLYTPDAIEPDGKLHRFPSNGKRGDDSGWYVMHSDGIPAGSFGDWRTGINQSWRADIGRKLTPEESAAQRARAAAMKREREAEEAKRHSDARAKASEIWKAASPTPDDFPYLHAKGIHAHVARLHNGTLVIPMRIDAELHSLQFITPEGEKRFLTGGRVAGTYCSIGSGCEVERLNKLCIAEGYATAATIYEATGTPTAAAFSAGNLLPVARAMRQKFPECELILCADDDYQTEGNPGVTKAREAAIAINGKLAIPDFGRATQ